MTTAAKGPKTARRTNTGRLYTIDGRQFWSVTTIIGNGLPKPAIAGWQAKTIAEYAVANHRQLAGMLAAVRIIHTDTGIQVVTDPDAVQAAVDWLKGSPWRESSRKMDIGSAVHAEAEAYVLGIPRPEPPALIRGYIDGFRDFIATMEPTYELTEATVYNPAESYAGTLDAVMVIGGVRLLVDYKSGKDIYPDVALQLAAYGHATHVLLPDGSSQPMPKVDAAAALHLREDGTWALIPVEIGEVPWAAFRYAREVMRWMEEGSKNVLSQPVTNPLALTFLYQPEPEAVAS